MEAFRIFRKFNIELLHSYMFYNTLLRYREGVFSLEFKFNRIRIDYANIAWLST